MRLKIDALLTPLNVKRCSLVYKKANKVKGKYLWDALSDNFHYSRLFHPNQHYKCKLKFIPFCPSFAEGAHVEVEDLHLIFKPLIKKKDDFYGAQAFLLEKKKCNECGLWLENCRFDAIHNFIIDRIACESYGICAYLYPQKAITREANLC
jgi:ferredoxin